MYFANTISLPLHASEATISGILALDIEASGLGPASYPIEIGWVPLDAAGRPQGPASAFLIRPHPSWDLDAWDAQAEALHGMTRADLERDGQPVAQAALRLAVAAAGRTILVTAQEDRAWIDMLVHTARRDGLAPPGMDIRDFRAEMAFLIDPAIRRASGTKAQQRLAAATLLIDRFEQEASAEIEEEGIRRHRAGGDARHMAAWWGRAATWRAERRK
jgi:hypothetical protein